MRVSLDIAIVYIGEIRDAHHTRLQMTVVFALFARRLQVTVYKRLSYGFRSCLQLQQLHGRCEELRRVCHIHCSLWFIP